ncbi:hypothetical protein I4U23_023132 [Adineta vaga]|nr:hypothetical protein I4U23_023132 [Adineta vaga]
MADHLLLLIAFVTFMFSFISGIVFNDNCYCGKTQCPMMIVQGSCGLVISLIHLLAIIFSWKPENMVDYSKNQRLAVKLILLCSQILVVFCIILFFVAHLYVITDATWEFISRGYSCSDYYVNTDRSKIFGYVAILLHYIMGICYVCHRLWNNASFLRFLNKIIQARLKNYQEDERILDIEKSDETI